MKFGVIVFPGTWSEVDCYTVLDEVFEVPVEYIWHKETDLSSYDCLILPGGFSYGDYLRCGAIARFSPVMESLVRFANSGGLVFGICNGFQILCESGLLPGVLIRNSHLEFRCKWTDLRVENTDTAFSTRTEEGQVISVPISHGEGNYFAAKETLKSIENNGQVLFRYSSPDGYINADSNPNGSINNIAGITNHEGNVLGMMPHPERCCDPIIGGTDGNFIFGSLVDHLGKKR
ncbi:MAG TPA: phosphoribosylformylglycinamidine synthase I [Dehalococcoidia bacterium]|nr:phosphoribosylformylglycinamidine synthase I [Chloroflexota bacterium]HCE76176.1 phosphoribosylformylglycinamidine synthase I [Dehalococcoidia bacterium]